MPEEETALDIDFILMMALLSGSAAAISTVVALLAKPIAMQLAQRMPLPQLPALPPMPGAIPPPTM